MTDEQKAALEGIAKAGRLTPDAVIEAARPKNSPLHSLFTWDDTVAAVKWRLEEARAIIVSIKVKIVTETSEYMVPRYVRDPTVASDVQGYLDVNMLKRNAPETLAVLRYEVERLEGIVQRVGSLVESLSTRKAATVRPAYERVERAARALRGRVGAPTA